MDVAGGGGGGGCAAASYIAAKTNNKKRNAVLMGKDIHKCTDFNKQPPFGGKPPGQK